MPGTGTPGTGRPGRATAGTGTPGRATAGTGTPGTGTPGTGTPGRGRSGWREAGRGSSSQDSAKLLVVAKDRADVRLGLGVVRHPTGLADRPGAGVVGGHGEVDAAKAIELPGDVAGSPVEVGGRIG